MLNEVGEAGKEAVVSMLLNLSRGIHQHQTLSKVTTSAHPSLV